MTDQKRFENGTENVDAKGIGTTDERTVDATHEFVYEDCSKCAKGDRDRFLVFPNIGVATPYSNWSTKCYYTNVTPIGNGDGSPKRIDFESGEQLGKKLKIREFDGTHNCIIAGKAEAISRIQAWQKQEREFFGIPEENDTETVDDVNNPENDFRYLFFDREASKPVYVLGNTKKDEVTSREFNYYTDHSDLNNMPYIKQWVKAGKDFYAEVQYGITRTNNTINTDNDVADSKTAIARVKAYLAQEREKQSHPESQDPIDKPDNGQQDLVDDGNKNDEVDSSQGSNLPKRDEKKGGFHQKKEFDTRGGKEEKAPKSSDTSNLNNPATDPAADPATAASPKTLIDFGNPAILIPAVVVPVFALLLVLGWFLCKKRGKKAKEEVDLPASPSHARDEEEGKDDTSSEEEDSSSEEE